MTNGWQVTLLPDDDSLGAQQDAQVSADVVEEVESPTVSIEEKSEEEESETDAALPSLAEVLTQLRRLISPLTNIGKVKPSAADAPDSIDQALRRLPAGAAFGEALDEVRARLEGAVTDQRRAYAEEFGRHEAAFIRAVREAGVSMREQDSGWRVGPIELFFRRGAAQACALYNHEEIVRWTAVGDVSDLDKIMQRGTILLERARVSLSDDLLVSAMWNAYGAARSARVAARNASPDVVPILDFYRDLRIALVRHDLDGKRPESKLAHAEMPKWAFLYHLDRYRALSAEIPPERRLGFQTGSQAESARGRCVTLNGLDAAQEYRQFCHVLPPRGIVA